MAAESKRLLSLVALRGSDSSSLALFFGVVLTPIPMIGMLLKDNAIRGFVPDF